MRIDWCQLVGKEEEPAPYGGGQEELIGRIAVGPIGAEWPQGTMTQPKVQTFIPFQLLSGIL